jgi:hypothetical protein
MYVLIAFDGEHGLLHPVTSQLSTAGPAEKQLGQAADFVRALVNCGSCKAYELESDEWVLEVRLATNSDGNHWTH